MKRRHEVSSKSTSKKVTFRPPPQSQPERKDAGHQSRCLVQFVAPKLIPTWSENSVFVMDQQFCAVPITQHCKNCYKLCFDKGLRGLPPKTFRWFLDEESDATTKFKLDKYKDIKNQIFKYMRKQEIELRYISRRGRTSVVDQGEDRSRSNLSNSEYIADKDKEESRLPFLSSFTH